MDIEILGVLFFAPLHDAVQNILAALRHMAFAPALEENYALE